MEGGRMLEGLRALDLTDRKGYLCGKILCDLGVDVIKVERPGAIRDVFFIAYNTGKRCITLDIEKREGREILLSLIGSADFLIESFDPGYLDSLGVGYEHLRRRKEALIMTSITPFGQAGPYSSYKASDLTIMAMAGFLYLTGRKDGKPVNVSIPQSYLLGGADGAVGTLIAYHWRKRTGRGQHVDVSLQQSVAWFLGTLFPHFELEGTILRRMGPFRYGSENIQRQLWPCKDGYVVFFMLGGLQGAKTLRGLVQWMDEEGHGDEFLSGLEWERFDMLHAPQELIDRVSQPIYEFFKEKTKKEIMAEAVKRGISVCPVNGVGDLLSDPHLEERGFWVYVEDPELGISIPYPSHFAKFSVPPMKRRQRAPMVGEDNIDVYGELGLSKKEIEELSKEGVL